MKFASDPSEIEYRVLRGTVAGTAVWSETSVNTHIAPSRTDGFGNVIQGATSVTSSSKEVNSFFLCLPDGEEQPVKTWNTGFAVRDGHLVSVVYARTAKGGKERLTGLRNHVTGRTCLIENNIREVSRTGSLAKMALAFIVLFFVLLAFMSAGGAFVWTVIAALAIFIARSRACRKVDMAVEQQTLAMLEEGNRVAA